MTLSPALNGPALTSALKLSRFDDLTTMVVTVGCCVGLMVIVCLVVYFGERFRDKLPPARTKQRAQRVQALGGGNSPGNFSSRSRSDYCLCYGVISGDVGTCAREGCAVCENDLGRLERTFDLDLRPDRDNPTHADPLLKRFAVGRGSER